MSAVNNLLDKYRKARSIASDSALADSLRMTRQGVHQWRKGLSWPSEDHVIAMANAIGEPAERWFVAINADRASPAARKVWLRLAQAAAVMLLAVNVAPAHAGTVSTPDNPGQMYIMSTCADVSAALESGFWVRDQTQKFAPLVDLLDKEHAEFC